MPDLIITPGSGLIEFVKEGEQSPTVYRLEMSQDAGLILNAPLTSSVGIFAPNLPRLVNDNTFTGTTTFNGNTVVNGNFSVFGSTTLFSASNVYISSSQLTIEDNILTLNAFSPYLRYAGIEMVDSGSGTLSSMLWDGQGDYFFLSGSGVNGKIITGPDNQADLTSNYVPKATAGYKLGNSLIYDDGTNVGIGTTNPSTLLTVGSTTTTTSSMSLQGEYQSSVFNNTNIFNFRHGGFDRWRLLTIQNSVASNDFDFRINSINAATTGYDSFVSIKGLTGNVGIGTSSPLAKLDVRSQVMIGDASIGGAAYQTLSIGGHTRIHGTYRLQFGSANGGYASIGITGTTTGTLTFNTWDGTADVERLRIVNTNGNVGIGTTTVSRKLHTYTDTGPIMRLQSSGSNASIEFIPSSGHNRYNWLIGAQQNISDAFEITPSTATNGTTFSNPSILVKSDGNVGIGTTGPTQKLEVAGYVMAGEGSYRTNIYGSNGGAWIGFGDTGSLNSLGRIGAYSALLILIV